MTNFYKLHSKAVVPSGVSLCSHFRWIAFKRIMRMHRCQRCGDLRALVYELHSLSESHGGLILQVERSAAAVIEGS